MTGMDLYFLRLSLLTIWARWKKTVGLFVFWIAVALVAIAPSLIIDYRTKSVQPPFDPSRLGMWREIGKHPEAAPRVAPSYSMRMVNHDGGG